MKIRKIRHALILKILFSLCITVLIAARPCPATDKSEVLVMGDSRIYTDILAARSAAVSQCLFSAIEKSAIEIIPAAGLTENFEIISDLIASQRNEFISDYKVLKEVQTEKHYRVLVQVTVSLLKLKESLAEAGIILSSKNLPTILFLITEQQVDDISAQYWWRTEKSIFQSDSAARSMKKIFAEKDFPVIDDEMVPPGLFEDLMLSSELTEGQAIELGKRLNADIVVTGKAVAREMPNRMGETVLTFKATIDAQALITETGEPIGRITNSATKVNRDISLGSNEALSEAGTQAGIDLSTQILSEWHARMSSAGKITLTITGSDILPYLVLFRNELKTIEGISSQQTLEMTPDQTILQVKYDKTSRDLADALLLKTFDPFGINIYEISQNTLNIELMAK